MKKSKKIHSLSKINPIKTIKEFRITKRTLRIVGCGVALAVLMLMSGVRRGKIRRLHQRITYRHCQRLNQPK